MSTSSFNILLSVPEGLLYYGIAVGGTILVVLVILMIIEYLRP